MNRCFGRLLVASSILLFNPPFIAPLAAQTESKIKPIPVILSSDIGNEIDDQWAIAYLFTNPAFHVVGAISAQAPSLPDPSAHASYLLLCDEVENRLGLRVHAPLIEGASTPLKDLNTPQPSKGSQFLITASRGFNADHRLTVVVIGAATDVASAMLQDPTLVNRIRIVAMAFGNSSSDGGNEYNVQNDPRAWEILLNSNVPITIGAGDTCRKYLALDYEQAKQLLAGHGPTAAWLWAEYRAWYYRMVKPLRVDDFSKPWFIWDIITLADLRGFATESEGPRPELRDDLSLVAPTNPRVGAQGISWITSVDSKRLWADFTANLDEFQRTHAIDGNKNQNSDESFELETTTP
jgi:inosine-uridine nucleoside N-ribohydrolase